MSRLADCLKRLEAIHGAGIEDIDRLRTKEQMRPAGHASEFVVMNFGLLRHVRPNAAVRAQGGLLTAPLQYSQPMADYCRKESRFRSLPLWAVYREGLQRSQQF